MCLNLKTGLPFQLVVATPTETVSEKTVEAKVVNTTTVNETVNDNEIAITAVETVAAVNSSETVTLATPTLVEEAKSETGKRGIWDWLWNLLS